MEQVTTLSKPGGRLPLRIPDWLLALLYGAMLFIPLLPPAVAQWLIEAEDELYYGLLFEAGFLMMQGTLIDIATRIRKRPPIWAIPLIGAALLLFSFGSAETLRLAIDLGAVVLAPLLVSLWERFMVLWHMPAASPVEKIAARALVSNRIVTGLVLLASVVVVGVLEISIWWTPPFSPMLAAGAIYFAVAAVDRWRVARPAFAERPRVLFRFDVIGIGDLSHL